VVVILVDRAYTIYSDKQVEAGYRNTVAKPTRHQYYGYVLNQLVFTSRRFLKTCERSLVILNGNSCSHATHK